MTIGEKLKMLRGNKTQKEVASRIGVTKSALAMYEQDRRRPRDDIKIKLASYYGVSVQKLFYDTEPRAPL